MTYSVYILKCPIKKSVVYVGSTNDPERRFASHLTCSGYNNKLIEFITELKAKNLTPEFQTISSHKTKAESIKTEKYVISKFSYYNDLYNTYYNSKIPKVLKEKNTTKQITINIPVTDELKKRLQKKADKEKRKLSTYCRLILEEIK